MNKKIEIAILDYLKDLDTDELVMLAEEMNAVSPYHWRNMKSIDRFKSAMSVWIDFNTCNKENFNPLDRYFRLTERDGLESSNNIPLDSMLTEAILTAVNENDEMYLPEVIQEILEELC